MNPSHLTIGGRIRLSVLSLFLALFLLFPPLGTDVSRAFDATLQWNPVSDNREIGYKVHFQADSINQPFSGTGAENGASPIDVGNSTSYTLTGLDPTHIWYFAVTAYAGPGQESSYSNIVTSTDSGQRTNVALTSNGAKATASSAFSTSTLHFSPDGAINGDRRGLNWGSSGGWNDASANSFPDWLQISFNDPKTIGEIDVFTVQDAYSTPAEPTATMTFSRYGVTAFDIQYWNGAAWTTVPGGSITGNRYVWRKVVFTPVTTDRIRVLVNGSIDGMSRITEVEAYTVGNSPPSVKLTAPANGSWYTAPVTVNLAAAPSDIDGTITKVEFYSGATLLASTSSFPYTFPWTNVPAGTFNLMARAYDNLGATAESSYTAITVSHPPFVAITSPLNNAMVSGTVSVAARATDDYGINRVEFYLNGSMAASDSTSPYLYSWNTVSSAAGSYLLEAKAYDIEGNTTMSAPVTVTVLKDSTAPAVSLQAPAANATVAGTVQVSASATDNASIARVEFFVDSLLRAAIGTLPYAFSWITTAETGGSHTIYARAYDPTGNMGQSAPVTVTVANAAQRTNVALQSNGGTATASSTYSGALTFPAQGVINGDRKGINWGGSGGWNDNTPSLYPDWVQITFNGQKSISEIDVFTVQDNYASPAVPTSSMTFTKFGITAFDLQYWNGSAWATLPGGSITGNRNVWRSLTFSPVTTDRIRVLVNASIDGTSRITEIEAYGQ